MSYPLLFSLTGLISGIFLVFTETHWIIKSLLILAPLFLAIKHRPILFFSLGLSIGFITAGLQVSHSSSAFHLDTPIEYAQGRILSSKQSTFSTEYVIKTDILFTEPTTQKRVKILLKTTEREHLNYLPGTPLTMKHLSLYKIPPQKNPCSVDRRKYFANKGIHLQGEAKELSPGSDINLLLLFQIIRQTIIKRVDAAFLYFPEEKELLKTIILGQENIPYFLRNIGIQSGIYHLLVISGLHIGFLLLLLKAIFIPFAELNNRHPKLFPALALILLWLYTGITGFKVPVARAVMMVSLFFIGDIFERDTNILVSVMASAFVLLLINPYNLTDASFQLSFLTTTGIILFWQRFNPLKKGYLLSVILTSLAAQISATPVLLYHFGYIYPIGLINNIFFVPLAGAVVMLSFISFIIPVLFPVLRVLLTLFLRTATLSAPLSPPIHFNLSVSLLLAFYAFLLLSLYAPRRRICSQGLLLFGCLSLLFHFAAKHMKETRENDICYFLSLSKPSVIYLKETTAVALLADHYKTTEIQDIIIPLLNKHKTKDIFLFYTTASWNHTATFNTLKKHFPSTTVYESDKTTALPFSPYLDIFYYSALPSSFRTCSKREQIHLPSISVECVGEEKTAFSYILYAEDFSICIAPFIGETTAEAINGTTVDILYLADIKQTKKTKQYMETLSYQHLILPDKYKKFEPLTETNTGKILSLKHSAVKIIPKNKTPHISYYYE
ncbi:MAG: ComEC/Rec2 family competence protein [Candidatus Ratteibacteria bacterium]